jgi:mono/diheme cytochrome c family protein
MRRSLLTGLIQAAALPCFAAPQLEDSSSPWAAFVEPDFPFFSSVVDARGLPGLPGNNLTPRGLVLNLGHDCWACFDLDLLRVAAVWQGGAVTPVSMAQGSYHVAGKKAPEGQDQLPRIDGRPWLATGIYPGWQTGMSPALADPRDRSPDPGEVGCGPLPEDLGRFKAIRLLESGVALDYQIARTPVTERVTARLDHGRAVVQRCLHLASVPSVTWLLLGQAPVDESGGALTRIELHGEPGCEARLVEWRSGSATVHAVRLAPSKGPAHFHVLIGDVDDPRGQAKRQDDGTLNPHGATPWGKTSCENTALARPRWRETLTTRARLAPSTNAFVVDHVALPLANPWRRNVRLADLAFFPSGKAAAVTFDGDLWMISGLHDDLDQVLWRRFASGLHEPLGLCTRDDELLVHDRNGIWRLRDTDGNGEADHHELFASGFAQTAETREFASGLRAAPDGSFVISKGGQRGSTLGRHSGTILRISADGRSVEVLAHGLRQPWIGVHPETGRVTASDQQGHYIPTTPLHLIDQPAFHGFVPLILPKERYPAPIADPLTWIPHSINASGGGQVWLTGDSMGPLSGKLVHIGYYRPELFLVLLDEHASQPGAAVTSLTRDLPFPPLAGAVNPLDGRPYFTGFQIWGTTAPEISGIARLRPTRMPCTLPVALKPMRQGILLRFDVELSPTIATNPANYSAERWNYRRSAEYGSPHYRPDGSKGQEPLIPSSAYLSLDRKSVFIGLPDIAPVMQMRLGWALTTESGMDFAHNAYFTPHQLTQFDPAAEGFPRLTVDLTPRAAIAQSDTPVIPEEGRRLSELMGCVACHSSDGSTLGKVGPSWKGLFGSVRDLAGHDPAVADDQYLRESIEQPAAKLVRGYERSDAGMPSYEGVLSGSQIDALISYIKTLE